MKESTEHAPAELSAFIDIHTMFLEDPELIDKPREIIRERRCNAEWALVQQMEHLVQQFEQFDDPYLRERKLRCPPGGRARHQGTARPPQPGGDEGRQGPQGRDADRRRPRPVAGRRHLLQGTPLRFLHHRRRRRHLAYGDPRPQHGHSLRGRPGKCPFADPRRRIDDRRRPARRRHRQSGRARAGGIPAAQEPDRAGRHQAKAPEDRQIADDRRY
jgi:hypothetical protein